MFRYLFRSAAAWTAVGLAGGLGYREITRQAEFAGRTQLAVVHTHALTLGTLLMLLLLALAAGLPGLATDRRLRWGAHLLNAGLVVTVGMLAVKGTAQVLDKPWADHAALAGVSGLGHMTLTAAMVLLLPAIGRAAAALQAAAADRVATTATAGVAEGVDHP